MSAGREFGEVIEDYFPYDGPHSRDSVVGAVYGAAALVRYLNNATGPGDGGRTVERGPIVYRVVGGVQDLVEGLDQLLGQLADAVVRLAGDPTLYDDRRDRGAGVTLGQVVAGLEQARRWGGGMAAALGSARDGSSHLGHD